MAITYFKILLKAEGTNVLIQEPHVLALDSLDEYEITSIPAILDENLSVTSDAGAYKIVADGVEKVINKPSLDTPADNLFDRPIFTNIIKFDTKNSILSAIVPIQVSPSETYGEIIITYQFDGTSFFLEKLPIDY